MMQRIDKRLLVKYTNVTMYPKPALRYYLERRSAVLAGQTCLQRAVNHLLHSEPPNWHAVKLLVSAFETLSNMEHRKYLEFTRNIEAVQKQRKVLAMARRRNAMRKRVTIVPRYLGRKRV